MKKVLIFLFSMLALQSFAALPFQDSWASEGKVFYLIHRGGPLKFHITVRKPLPGHMGMPVLKSTPSSLLVLMDPEEHVVAEKYWRVRPGENVREYVLDYPKAQAGIWQLRSTFSFAGNLTVQIQTTPELDYGILFGRSRILSHDVRNIRKSYFYVPDPINALKLTQPRPNDPVKKIQQLHLATRSRQTACFNAEGQKLFNADIYEIVSATQDIHCNSNIELPPGTTEETQPVRGIEVRIRREDQKQALQVKADSSMILPLQTHAVYQLTADVPPSASNELNDSGYLAIEGFPVIFCSKPETARAIAGSRIQAADRRFFSYRFQKDMYHWMKSLRREDLEIRAVPIAKYKKEWLADPYSRDLLKLFAYAEHQFKVQDINPDSLTFGTAPCNLDQLTLLYTLKRPYNPYYGNKALMNRIFLHYFRKWLSLSESGAFHDDPAQGAYCGGLEWSGWEGMVFTTDYISLAMMTPLADPTLIALWTEALRLPLYRFWSHRLTCENQSLHWPLKLYAMHMSTGNSLFRQLADDSLTDLGNPELSRSMKTGYFMEGYGADATYPGISASLLAFAVRFSGNDTALPILDRFYRLMGHTVVREPDGSLTAANGFAHRTLGTWLNCQYGGGVNLLADRLASAAVFAGTSSRASLKESEFDNLSRCRMPADIQAWGRTAGKNIFVYGMNCWQRMWSDSVFHAGEPVRNARLPMEEQQNFQKNFNSEFLACRKPAYYSFFYTGNYCWRWHKSRTFSTPFPEGTSIRDGQIYSSHPSRAWLPMQGMNIFWTPDFGIFLSAHNWSMYSQNLLRAERNGQLVDFPASYTSAMEEQKDSLQLTHRSKFLNMTIRRNFHMLQNGVRVGLQISAGHTFPAVALLEQIPYRIKSDLLFTCCENPAVPFRSGQTIRSLCVSRQNGSSILLTFSRPVTVRQGMRSSATQNYPKFQIGLLEIILDSDFQGKKPVEFSYSITSGKNSQHSQPAVR